MFLSTSKDIWDAHENLFMSRFFSFYLLSKKKTFLTWEMIVQLKYFVPLQGDWGELFIYCHISIYLEVLKCQGEELMLARF